MLAGISAIAVVGYFASAPEEKRSRSAEAAPAAAFTRSPQEPDSRLRPDSTLSENSQRAEGTSITAGAAESLLQNDAPLDAVAVDQMLQSDLEIVGPDSDFEEGLRMFAAERRDPDWAQATEAHILDVISRAAGLTVADVQVDCRSVTCRVRMTNADFAPNGRCAGFLELIDALSLKPVWELTGMHDTFGNRISFAYLRSEDTSSNANARQ
jgi:hypothetical protein